MATAVASSEQASRVPTAKARGSSASYGGVVVTNPIQSPGPAHYTPDPNVQSSGTSFQRFTALGKKPISYDNKVPGPGAHEPNQKCMSERPARPEYTMRARNNVPVTALYPGPGAYMSSRFSATTPAFSMGPRFAKSDSLLIDERGLNKYGERPMGQYGYMHTPGPGAHSPDFRLRSEKITKPSYSATQRPLTAGIPVTPGPGAYEQPTFTDENKFAVSMKSRRDGQVHSLSGAWPTGGGRLETATHPLSPGPAHYSPQHPRYSKPLESAPSESWSMAKRYAQSYALFTSSIDNPAAVHHMEKRNKHGKKMLKQRNQQSEA